MRREAECPEHLWNNFYKLIYIKVYKLKKRLFKMKKNTLKVFQTIAWILGFIALALLIYGIIRTLI